MPTNQHPFTFHPLSISIQLPGSSRYWCLHSITNRTWLLSFSRSMLSIWGMVLDSLLNNDYNFDYDDTGDHPSLNSGFYHSTYWGTNRTDHCWSRSKTRPNRTSCWIVPPRKSTRCWNRPSRLGWWAITTAIWSRRWWVSIRKQNLIVD